MITTWEANYNLFVLKHFKKTHKFHNPQWIQPALTWESFLQILFIIVCTRSFAFEELYCASIGT